MGTAIEMGSGQVRGLICRIPGSTSATWGEDRWINIDALEVREVHLHLLVNLEFWGGGVEAILLRYQVTCQSSML